MADKNNLGIRITTKIDENESIKNINKSLRDIQGKVQDLDINVDFKGITQDFNRAINNINTSKAEKQIKDSFDLPTEKLKGQANEINAALKDLGKTGTVSNIQTNKLSDGSVKDVLVTLKDYNNELSETVRLQKREGGYTLVNSKEVENLEKARKEQERLTKEKQKAYEKEQQESRKLIEQKKKEREKAIQYEQQTWRKIQENIDKENAKREKNNKQEKERANRYEQWWKNALESREQKEKDLQHTIEQAQRNAQLRADKLLTEKSKYIDDDQRKAINNYVDSMNRISKDTPDAQKAIQNLNMGFKETKGEIDQVSNRTMTLSDRFREAVSSTMVWASAMTVSIKCRQ